MSSSVRSLPHDKIDHLLCDARSAKPAVPLVPSSFFMFAISRRSACWILATAVLATAGWGTLRTRAQSAPPAAALPGDMSDGTTLLPNGWRIRPAGKHMRVGDMPLNLTQTPDSRYLIVASNGLAKPSFSVIDVTNWSVKSDLVIDNA